MRATAIAAAICAIFVTTGAAHAADKQSGPGTTGQMNKVAPPGVATNPGQVKAQQGDTSKASPGTVGASPGANTKSQGK